MSETPLELTYLGQAGFLFKNGEEDYLIDPYLSNYVVDGGIGSAELFSREFPVPVQLQALSGVKAVFVTHDHADHCDPDTLLPLYRQNPQICFICPQPAAAHLRSVGIPQSQIVTPEVNQPQKLGSLNYYAVPAAHYEFEQDESGAYSYFGYVIQIGERWLYHAGDTILYDGMIEDVLRYAGAIDIACLPVNGRDGWRERMGMTGNLDGAEALELTLRLHAQVLLPMHNDLFKVNHVNQAVLADLCDRLAPRQRVHWLQPGEKYFYVK
jgi:Predicted Zn-dependent hydrolases of the beta-lactamase fold